MNSEIEQRIVAMYFDNKDFEKNAQQTIGTLGQLKEGLNLEESVKGFDELEKAGKKLNLNQAKTTVTNLKNALGGLGTAVQKAFNIGTAPLHALDNFFGTFRSYVGKFVGFDLASKFVNSLESAMQQLTVAPIEAGWQMYQANVDSTKTIMSGTIKSYKEEMSKVNADWTYDEGEHMEFVKKHLRDLSDYAAKTVFSLQDMTSNVGKFTNQNIDLETSVTAMKGIANMTAKAGQSAHEASMAMYNFSQALGVGKMTTIDWKSIETANIATVELRDMFIKTAEAAGKLQKKADDYFITISKDGKKLAEKDWIKVSAENFRDTLKYDWLDKDIMLRVMQLYSNEGFDLDTLASWGFDIKDTELMEQLKAVGEEAMLAATQVRTFKKMWDALTESVQSSWADSMELIFGDMREATEFWTELNDKFSGIMDKIGKDRNDLLREWRGQTWDDEAQAWVRLEGAVDGREDLIQGIYGIIDAASSLGGAFSNAWSDVFGNITGETLQNITRGFREFVDSFKEWLGETNDADSRINKIRSGLSGVFSVLKIVWEVIKNMFGVMKEVIKPLIDPLINLFDKFGQWLKLDNVKNLGDILATLRDRFSQLWSKISGLGWSGVLGKIGEWMGSLWGQIREGVTGFLQENGLGGVVDWFVQLGDSIKAGFDSVVEWWNSDENKISGFFKGIWESVTGWFKPSVDADGHEVRSPIVQFFYRIRDGVSEAFESVKAWWEGSGIPRFFSGIWDAIMEVFTPKVTDITYDSTGRHETYGNSPFVQFFINTWESIKNTFEEVKSWGIWSEIGGFFSGVWDTISGIFTPKDQYDDKGFLLNEKGNSPFVQFFVDTWEGIKAAYEEVKSWGIWSEIGGFFSGVWDTISGIFTPKDQYDDKGFLLNEKGNSPFVQFFVDTWEGIKAAYEEVKSWGIWSEIGGFFSGVWDSISGLFKPVDQYDDRGFLMNAKGDAPIVKFFKDTWEGIKNVFTEVANWWNDPDNAISGFFKGIWESIMGLFNGTGEAAETIGAASETIIEAAPTGQVENKTGSALGILGEIIDKVKSFITEVIDKVAGVEIPPQVNTFLKGLGDFFLGITNILGEIMGIAGRGLAGEGSFGDWLWIIFGVITTIVTKIIDFKNTKNLAKINTQTFAQQFMSFALGLLAMASAIALLSTIEPGKMWPAVGVLLVLGAVVTAVLVFINKIQVEAGKNAPETKAPERLVGKLIDGITKVGMIAVALALLPEVIRAFGEAKKLAPELNGDDLMKTFLGLAGFIAAASAVLGILQKLTANKGLDPVVALKTGLAIAAFFGSLIVGFGTIGGTIGLFQSLSDQVQGVAAGSSAKANQKALLDAGETIKSLMSIVRGFWEGLSGAQTDGQKVESAQSILLEMAQQLEVFTAEKTSGLLRVLNLIGALSQIVSDVPDADKLSSFATTLGPLADGIAKFSYIMSGFTDENMQQFAYWNPDNLEAQVKNVEAVFRAFSHIDGSFSAQTASQFLNGIKFLNENMSAEDFKAFGHIVTGIVDSFDQAISTDSDAMGTMADSLMTNLSKAIKIGLSGNGADVVGAFDATPIVDSIVVALGYGETAIAAAVHDMVQAGLNSSATGKDGKIGYNFDDGFLSGLMSFIKNPEELLGGETGNGLNDMLYGVGGTAENPKDGSIFGQILGITGQMEGIEFPNMAEKLTESMKMTDADGNPIDLVGDLRETLTNFETELNETSAFEIKIVPTYDFSNLNAETLRNQLKDYPVRIPMMSPSGGGYSIPESIQVDFTGINAALDLDGLKSRLDNINVAVDANGRAMVDAINSMGSHIDRISAAISQIKVYVDMYGMIPKIDKALGDRASKSAATGVSSMLGNPYQYVDKPVPQIE